MVSGPVSRIGESPVWDGREHRLYWVDIPNGELRWLEMTSGRVDSLCIGEPLGFAALHDGGGLVLGMATGLRLCRGRTLDPKPLWVPPDLDSSRRMNDGSCDPAGRVVFGTTAKEPGRTKGTLWSFASSDGPRVVVPGTGMSNGLGWTADGGRLYHVDTETGQLAAFDYDVDRGIAQRRQVLHVVAPTQGLPDGLAVDADGCVWLAVWGAGEVRRLAPDGRVIGCVRVPTPNATSCAFSGQNLDQLFITTAQSGTDAGRQDAGAGRLFVADPRVQGQPVAMFKGREPLIAVC